MASTDARPIPIKNTAFRAVFPILDADGDLVTGATGLDSEVSQDQGTFADCTNEATEIATSSGMYYLDLTSTEMNADCVAVIVKTTSSGAKTTVLVFYPEEAGDINVDVTAWNGTAIPGVDTAGYPKVTIKDGTGTGEIDTTSGANATFTYTVTATPTVTVATPAEAEPASDLLSDVMAVVRGWLNDLLYTVLGIAGAWVMTTLGFKNWNAAKVEEALHNEKMKPYAEGVIRFVVDWLTRLLGRQPKVSEVLNWIAEQFPEVRNWIGRTDKERIGYIETFMASPGPSNGDAQASTGARTAAPSTKAKRPSAARKAPAPTPPKLEAQKPTPGAGTLATATP